MQTPDHLRPVNPIPPVVIAVVGAIALIELAFQAGALGLVGGPQAIGWRLEALRDYAFSGEIVRWMWETGRFPADHLMRFLSYPFVNASFTQALIACVFLLALGKLVAEAFGSWAFLAIFVVSGVGGALVYALVIPGPAYLTGAFPPAYGLIGAFTWLLWTKLAQVGANQSRAFTLIAVLMGLQLVFGLIAGGNSEWVADLAGFATGFGLSFFLAPGGWAKILSRLRQD